MAVCGYYTSGRLLLLLGCLHITITLCLADDDNSLEHGHSHDCGGDCSQGTNWVNLWYVWLILVTIFLLLLCGTTASCIKFCCKKKKPPVQTLPNHPYEVTVIAIDNDSTIHSTVTSYSSVQYPHMFAFGDPERSALSPPAYSLYALELPPAYEEAIKMAKPSNEVGASTTGPKLEDITEHEGPEEESDQQPEQQAVSNVADSPPQYEESEVTSAIQ
ncbi:transmembrane protein 52 isoform X1 [Phyllobates terribilis]|uniref:transmembrane protein 52 isoform X1 n=1 Tax=Phyllobates terribilis TaxID=111132 RepID=UPI003CCAFD8C